MAIIVYRHIEAAPIGNFYHDPFFFYIKILNKLN